MFIKIPEIISVDMIFWGHAEHLLMYNNVWGNLAQHLDKVVIAYQINLNFTDKGYQQDGGIPREMLFPNFYQILHWV